MKNLSSHHFIICFIEENQVNVAVGEMTDRGPQIVSSAKPKEWQDNTGLSDAIEVALEELQVSVDDAHEVLFGLPEKWVSGAEIKDGQKEVLKKISQKLHWKPLGFVVSLEAVSRYVSQKKGILSALFFDISPSQFRLAHFDHGSIVQQEEVGRSDDFISDIKEGLARFQFENIPSVFFFFSSLLSSSQIEELRQVFLHHDWLREKQFVQFPSVDYFSLEHVLEAVCIMGGGEAMKANGASGITHESAPPAPVHSKKENENDFGFTEVTGENVEPLGSSFGVPITREVMKKVEFSKKQDDSDLAISLDSEAEQVDNNLSEKPKKSWSFPFFRKKKDKLVAQLPQSSMIAKASKNTLKPKVHFLPIVLVVLLILLIAGLGGAYAYMMQTFSVVVEATLQTKSISKALQVTLDPDVSETNPEKAILKATIKTGEATGTEETSTTGSKIIGEKAKGTITLINKTESDKTFGKGTAVVADSKTFYLDDEVMVASATAKETDDAKTLEYGKKDVSVTAKEIGAEYNIEKEKDFAVANFSSDTYSARNEKEFSSGSSREIQAVSKDDYQRILSSLKKDLIEQAQKKLEEEKAEGEYIILTDTAKVTDEEYSAEIGDETNVLKLTATVEAEAYSYFSSDLKPIAQQYLLTEVPDQGVLLEDSVGILSKQSEDASTSGQLALDAELSAEYAPPTFSEDWINSISGKSVIDAERILEGKEEIKSVNFIFNPSWVSQIFRRLPSSIKHIQLNKKIE